MLPGPAAACTSASPSDKDDMWEVGGTKMESRLEGEAGEGRGLEWAMGFKICVSDEAPV